MKTETGLALVSALLVLAFLSLVGGGLLSVATIDMKIVDNFKTSEQLRFLAEAGIEAGRERLRTSSHDLSWELAAVSGSDRIVSTSKDLTALLGGDDLPLLPDGLAERSRGVRFRDRTGRIVGTYHVFLRNDAVDSPDSVSDHNGVVTLLAVARIGDGERVIEVEVKRGGFEPLPAALTLAGPLSGFEATDSDLLHIDGHDRCGGQGPRHAIAAIRSEDVEGIIAGIPPGTEARYTGVDPFPDIANLDATLSGKLKRPVLLEQIVSSFRRNATDVYDPGFGETISLSSVGGPADPRVVVIGGDAQFGPGVGFGVLLVEGILSLRGQFAWHGLVLVVGQGELLWQDATGEINGGIFLARTRGAPSMGNPVGDVLDESGAVHVALDAGGGNGISYDSCALGLANRELAYVPIAIREF